jgi:2-C-methyl-D-erythritol 2,4-cyclodiphosphate synthase
MRLSLRLLPQASRFLVGKTKILNVLFNELLIHDTGCLTSSEGVTLFRIGFGYDVHRLTEGRSLIIGGVKIPYHLGLMGHSDADVLTHAIIDAILGALARGDIGQHFPDSNPAYKDMDSLVMLKRVLEWVREDGFRVNNLDATVVAERPKLASSFAGMKARLSEVLGIRMDQINIKATTSEGLGFCGRQDGMEAFAVISLVTSTDPHTRSPS